MPRLISISWSHVIIGTLVFILSWAVFYTFVRPCIECHINNDNLKLGITDMEKRFIECRKGILEEYNDLRERTIRMDEQKSQSDTITNLTVEKATLENENKHLQKKIEELDKKQMALYALISNNSTINDENIKVDCDGEPFCVLTNIVRRFWKQK